tara:strand:+ start:2167 stop:2613 length:447 start_codon:yes stop_codon:yes gene_type:complete
MSGLRTIRYLKSWLEGEDTKIGWYSEKQRNTLWRIRFYHGNDKPDPCANVYLTPEGKEVIVTEVTDGLELNSKWDDVKMIGPVTKWVRGIYNMHITFHEFDDFKYKQTICNRSIECIKKSMFPSYIKWEKSISKEDINEKHSNNKDNI